ncbi:MAG: site-specific DNA-methyltransferase [Smithellaceae bacterium]|nr:site-specific DNA-methyltransferase [Smithellaceae bacterium]
MDGKSLNISDKKLNQLKEILPEAFTENKIDWEKLKAALGDNIEFKNERYVLNWAGKSDAFRVLQAPSTATLVPVKEESVNFDETENIFIEGENLEVLKVLQKSYFGKIKMIYIDPPYNTGNDHFIYPDRFAESREDYLSRIGDKDEAGLMTREGLFRKNSQDSGHYHSNWLSMMYPRLFLARNLLRDDGVIFVSIDDNEVHNLRLLMNEVFGEENFLGTIIWKKKTNGNNMGNIPPVHDYIVVYGKQVINEEMLYGFPISGDYIKSNYSNPDNDTRGDWTTSDLSANHKGPYFLITNPVTGEEFYPPKGRYWVFNEKEVERRINDGRIIFGKYGDARPVQKIFLKERKSLRVKPESWWDKHSLNEDGTKELGELFFPKIFVHSKPSQLINHITNISTISSSDIVLDFFAGSCTTAHAVLMLNREDGGNRKFICIQLPEKCDENSEAFKAGYKTIAEIGKERIRRVIEKIREEQEGKLDLDGNSERDLGFKVFKLQESNFKIWRTNIETEEELVAQMQQHLEPLDERAKIEDVLYELLLKAGVSLTAKIKNEKGFVLVNDDEVALMLEKADEKIIKQIIAAKPKKIFTLDRLFKNNDKLKTNTALQMKDAGIEFKVI